MRLFFYRLRRALELARLSWRLVDGDWSSIAELMRWQIRRTRQIIADDNFIVGAQRVCRQMLIAETLLTRMLDGLHFDNALEHPLRSDVGKIMLELERQDIEMLCRVLRHLPEWWD